MGSFDSQPGIATAKYSYILISTRTNWIMDYGKKYKLEVFLFFFLEKNREKKLSNRCRRSVWGDIVGPDMTWEEKNISFRIWRACYALSHARDAKIPVLNTY